MKLISETTHNVKTQLIEEENGKKSLYIEGTFLVVIQ